MNHRLRTRFESSVVHIYNWSCSLSARQAAIGHFWVRHCGRFGGSNFVSVTGIMSGLPWGYREKSSPFSTFLHSVRQVLTDSGRFKLGGK